MKSLSSDLRRIENQANDQNEEIEVQKKELELTEGRLQVSLSNQYHVNSYNYFNKHTNKRTFLVKPYSIIN